MVLVWCLVFGWVVDLFTDFWSVILDGLRVFVGLVVCGFEFGFGAGTSDCFACGFWV